MKIRVARVLISALLFATACGAASAAAGKAAPKESAKKEEAPPKIEGMTIARQDGRFMGLEVADGRFKLRFYDDKKKPEKPTVSRAVLRWDPSYKVGNEHVVLLPGAENMLTSERFIRPPYNFKLFIILLTDIAAGGEPVAETYTVDFRQ